MSIRLEPLTDQRARVGVLWSGDTLFEGSVETLEMLRSKGKQIIFVTNNSTKSGEDYRQKLESMGVPAEIVFLFDCDGECIHNVTYGGCREKTLPL